MKTIIAMVFILVLRLSPGAAGAKIDSVYSHFYTLRLEADSCRFFAWICTTSLVWPSDTGRVEINYYAKRLIDPPQLRFLVNRGVDPYYARPATDTIFITYKQSGFLTIQTGGDGMLWAWGKNMLAVPESTENVYLMQPGLDTIIIKSHIIKIPNSNGFGSHAFYEEGLLKWLSAVPSMAISNCRPVPSSMPARRSGGTFDVLGRILPASRQGAPLIEIGRTGALVRKLQPAQ